jgi:hypothetical protein
LEPENVYDLNVDIFLKNSLQINTITFQQLQTTQLIIKFTGLIVPNSKQLPYSQKYFVHQKVKKNKTEISWTINTSNDNLKWNIQQRLLICHSSCIIN